MKTLIVVIASLLSLNVLAAQERHVLQVSSCGAPFDVYFTPADHIVGQAVYNGTLTDVDAKVTQRVVGFYLAPMGSVRIVIHGQTETESTTDLLGAVYSQNGGIVQLDPENSKGAPALKSEALKGQMAVAVESQHWGTADGLITITGGYIPALGRLQAIDKLGNYEAVGFDWNKVQFAFSCL